MLLNIGTVLSLFLIPVFAHFLNFHYVIQRAKLVKEEKTALSPLRIYYRFHLEALLLCSQLDLSSRKAFQILSVKFSFPNSLQEYTVIMCTGNTFNSFPNFNSRVTCRVESS